MFANSMIKDKKCVFILLGKYLLYTPKVNLLHTRAVECKQKLMQHTSANS